MLNLECSLDDVEEKDDDDLLAMVSITFTRFRTQNIVFQVVLLVLNPFKYHHMFPVWKEKTINERMLL